MEDSRNLRAWVGCSGWFYWHWKGLFYPAEEGTHKWFRHYTTTFRTVELNAPFYRWPLPATVKRWVRDAPAGFRYCIKVNQEITHEKRFAGTRERVLDFCGMAETLGTKLGCFLFQCPPSFRYSPEMLQNVLHQMPTSLKCVVEFRHKSWWNDEVFNAFQKHRVCFCSVSGPRLPDELVRTTDFVYLRFHGRDRWYRYNYSHPELRNWAQRLAVSGASEAWVYFNNDPDARAIHNAKTFRNAIRRAARERGVTSRVS
ncbi:MAG TPA: DUF72 domain-containing protein [Methylomirabilota bacterium]|nr:DUF72 domain-containing protein [Methylomirabilota bacterium]